jgi:hypothetical protein
MECARVQERLSDYIEGFLSDEEKKLFDEHLGSCVACGAMLSDLRMTIDYMNDLEEREPPPWLAQKIMNRVRQEAKQSKSIWQRLFYPIHVKLPLEAVGVALVALTALYVFQSVQPVLKSGRLDDRADIPMAGYDTSSEERSGSSLKEPRFTPSSQAPVKPAQRTRKDFGKTDAEEMIKPMDDLIGGSKKTVKDAAEMKSDELRKDSGEVAVPEPAKSGVQGAKAKERSVIAERMEDRPHVYELPVESQEMAVTEEGSGRETDKEGIISYSASSAEDEVERGVFSPALSKKETQAGKLEGEHITILVGDVERTLSKIEKLTETLNGGIIRKEFIRERVIVTLRLSQDTRKKFFDALNKLGEVKGDILLADDKANGDIVKLVIEKSAFSKE